MKPVSARLPRLLASLVTLTVAAACSAMPDAAAGERSGAESSAVSVTTPSPIILPVTPQIDPASVCASTAADFTLPFTSATPYHEVLSGSPESSCTYGVIEVDGTSGHVVDFTVWADASVTQGMTQSQCAQSSLSYDVFGYVPAHFVVIGPGKLGYVPAAWESLPSSDATVTPVWENATCAYSWIFNGSSPLPYTKVRLATQAFQFDGYGNHRLPLNVVISMVN